MIAQHEPHEHEHDAPPPPQEQHGEDPHLVVQNANDDQLEPPKKYQRVPAPDQEDPATRFAKVKAEADSQGEWGAGDGGYKPPKSAADKMRCVTASPAPSCPFLPRSR